MTKEQIAAGQDLVKKIEGADKIINNSDSVLTSFNEGERIRVQIGKENWGSTLDLVWTKNMDDAYVLETFLNMLATHLTKTKRGIETELAAL